MGSAGSGRGPPGASLERRGSFSSMTERTFRSPSPGRDSPVPSAIDAPPVPTIPEHLFSPVERKPSKRASSMEAPPMRLASPPPQNATGRGSSLGPGNLQTAPRAQRRSVSNLSELTSLERPGSRGSVNFSYPTNSRPTSPTYESRRLTSPSRRTPLPRITSPGNQNLVYDPHSRSFLPEAQLLAIEQELRDAESADMSKKKRVVPKQAQGTNLAEGTVGGRPHGTAVGAVEAAPARLPKPKPISQPALTVDTASAAEATKPAPRRKKKVVVSDSESESGYTYNSSDNDSDVPANTYTTRPGLVKKPSVVREDREREENEDDTPTRASTFAPARPVSPTPIRSAGAGRGHGRGRASASAAFAEGKKHTRSASQPTPDATLVNGPGLMKKDSLRNGRVQSVSPARTPHFTTLATPENLMIRHQPPPRSISPRKSAMKNSTRGTSPGEDTIIGSGHSASPSEASTAGDEHLSVTRKKANRVSFDDGKIVVMGQAAPTAVNDAPMVPSPQPKRSWFKGLGKKKDVSEDDDLTKPRPALPSFGSVREKKPLRETTPGRPLVRPGETPQRTLLPSPPLFTGPTGEVVENPLGLSTDQVAGTVLAQDAASKNSANISKSREPLAPEVTSKEASGYNSDDAGSDYSLEAKPPVTDVEDHIDKSKDTLGAAALKEASNGKANEPVPEINVLQATPNESEKIKEWPDMPGGWEPSTSFDVSDEAGQARSGSITPTAGHRPTDPTPADIGIAEPDPAPHPPGTPVVGAIATENLHHTHAIAEETEDETERDSVYSDAAEDLSDVEGDGFQSLNAVVESPVTSPVPGLAITTPPESPTMLLGNRNQLTRQSSEPDATQGWDKASQYWSGLSADKKRQKEIEAQEARVRAIAEDPEPETTPTAPKPKKKKKVAPQMAPEPVNPERTYMIKPGSKMGHDDHTPVMRTSMRAPAPKPVEEPVMRKSMRGEGSKRAPSQPAPPVALKQRPMSLPPNSSPVKHTRNMSASAAAAPMPAKRTPAAPAPALRRKGSGDSDSSFKRSRPATESISLRRSMRSTEDSGATASSRFSIRSLSPVSTFRRPASPTIGQQSSMRSTLRNANAGGRTLRGPAPRAKSPSRILGFGRTSSSAQKHGASSRPRNSRFGDSSDEDEGPLGFHSRFADSSDEDEPAPLPLPAMKSKRTIGVTGSLRRTTKPSNQRANSPDFSDNDENTPTAKNTKANSHQNGTISSLVPSSSISTKPSVSSSKPATAPSQQGLALSSGSLRRSGSGRDTLGSPTTATAGGNSTTTSITAPPIQRRRGIMSSILGRNRKVDKSGIRKMEGESVMRRDTGMERSKGAIEALRTPASTPAVGDGQESISTFDAREGVTPVASAQTKEVKGKGKDPIPRVGSPAGKLRKRTPSPSAVPQVPKTQNTSWPLTPSADQQQQALQPPPTIPSAAAENDIRPYSSDGVTTNKPLNNTKFANIEGTAVDPTSTCEGDATEAGERPEMGSRRFTATGLGEVDMVGVRPNRKKGGRFAGLKRVFGRR